MRCKEICCSSFRLNLWKAKNIDILLVHRHQWGVKNVHVVLHAHQREVKNIVVAIHESNRLDLRVIIAQVD